MAGRGVMAGYMPYGDANAIVMDMAQEVLPIVKNTPVLAGICGTDPFRLMPVFLKQIKEAGFSGIQNFPTVGLCDGMFRQNLEETEMGFGLEVNMIRKAHEMDLFTAPYAFNAEESIAMAEAGADMIVIHLGLTPKEFEGARAATSLSGALQKIREVSDAAKSVNPDIILLCHGGPISTADNAEYILKNTPGLHGYHAGLDIESHSSEMAVKEQVKKLKELEL